MMPVYAMLTVVILARRPQIARRTIVEFIAAFAIAAAPLAIGFLRHPDTFRETVIAYRLYDATRFNILQGLREMASWLGLTARTEVYYDFFNPVFLFMTGRVLLFPLAVLLPIGIGHIAFADRRLIARVSLAGFLAAPFAASLTAEPPAPGRILYITPFAAVVSIYGLRCLLSWVRALRPMA
jgi:hypothetical protein